MSKVTLHTNKGDISINLFDEKAPKTVQNFLSYVNEGHYDKTIFHRVMQGFMIEGGEFEPGMNQKPPLYASIQNEANNGLKNTRGTVAMARSPHPHSATSKFFINLADSDFLNHTAPSVQGWGYAVFGEVVEGMGVVDEIAKVQTRNMGNYENVPVENVIVETAKTIC